MNTETAAVKKSLEILGLEPKGIYVRADNVSFIVDKLQLKQVDLLAEVFRTSRINFCKEEGMTTAASAGGYEVEIFGAQL